MDRGRRPEAVVAQHDLDWLDEAVACQWEMPIKAGPFWRRPGVRHLRAFAKVAWAHLNFNPLQPDWKGLWRAEWLAYAIRRGWC